jgi:hypothetical protein
MVVGALGANASGGHACFFYIQSVAGPNVFHMLTSITLVPAPGPVEHFDARFSEPSD